MGGDRARRGGGAAAPGRTSGSTAAPPRRHGESAIRGWARLCFHGKVVHRGVFHQTARLACARTQGRRPAPSACRSDKGAESGVTVAMPAGPLSRDGWTTTCGTANQDAGPSRPAPDRHPWRSECTTSGPLAFDEARQLQATCAAGAWLLEPRRKSGSRLRALGLVLSQPARKARDGDRGCRDLR